jgi:hypothetical protein
MKGRKRLWRSERRQGEDQPDAPAGNDRSRQQPSSGIVILLLLDLARQRPACSRGNFPALAHLLKRWNRYQAGEDPCME